MNSDLNRFVERFQSHYPHTLISLLTYPHPLSPGGVILIFQDDTPDWLTVLGQAYAHVPEDLTLHCLRESEVDRLALPGLFAPPLQINERPHLLHWLKAKGDVVYGLDLRERLPPPPEPRALLTGHIEGCMDYLRRYGVLTLLAADQYVRLVGLLEREMRSLMATALLLRAQWDVELESAPMQFEQHFPDQRALLDLWRGLQAQRAVSRDAADVKQAAFEAVWLFEQFIAVMRKELL